MQALLRKIRQILKDRRTRKFFTRAVSSVAAIVVFVTTYALILPAITLEKTAVCGIEAHQHDDSCYEERLVCGQEESDGHQHDDSCYSTTTELTCGIQEHQHSEENGCYDADGNLVCQLQEHTHDDSCYEEVRTLTCGMEESEGHHHTDACYEKVLVCGKEVHTHSDKCYEEDSSTDSAEDGDSVGMTSDSVDAGDNENTGENGDTGNTVPGASDSDASAGEEQSDSYVPELEPLDIEAVLDSHTDFYYFHAEEGEKVPANSAEITEWKKVDEETALTSTDLVKMYLAYTIPAGSLNATNPTARYRLPGNIHLSDKQIKAINLYENGIAAGYREISAASENDEKDQAEENYKKYLGVEAVEGDRRPDEQLMDGAQEYISAVVRAENVYDEEGLYGEKGACLGQDLIFTFAPYSVEKNQNTYDADRTLISAGEKITGWFACDFKLNQIDWEQEDENKEEDIIQEDTNGEENTDEESIGEDGIGQDDNDNNIENTDTKDNAEKTAKVIFVQEDQEKEIEEIRRVLRMDGEIDDGTSSETMTDTPEETGEDQDDMDDQGDQVFKAGTLTYEGDDYSITLDYGEDAKIPENATLSVREITAETDKEAYEACLEQAGQQVAADDKTSVDQKASRFFDIEILVTETESDGTEKTVKIEPAAPVSVNIRINEKPASQESESDQSEPTVLHFAEEGVEQIDSTVTDSRNNDKEEQKTEIQFEAESFSVYGVVYTVDFEYSVNGKMYQFSLPGGGFVSFTDLVEVLGIIGDTNSEENGDENGSVSAENTEENAANEGTEENSVNSDTNTALTLGDVEVSEATRKFVEDVASVEFSSPELVDVSKVDADTTVGQIKESRGLECQYSAELTEAQIAEINAQTVEAGDWALISVQPFMSEETLTVTMKNGDRFVVRVTDAQITSYDSIDRNRDYIIYVDQVVGQEHRYYALRRDGASVRVPGNDLDALGNDFIWRFNYDGTGCWWYSGSQYIDVDLDRNPVAVGNTWRYSWSVADNNSGFDIFGYAHGDQHLSWDSTNGFKVSNSHDVSIKVYEQTTYNYRVETSNAKWGTVGHDAVTGLTDFNAVTDKYKKNANILTAASIGDASFRYWMLGDDIVSTNLSINVGALTFTKDNQLLKAVFGKEYSSEATQRINEWVDTLTGNPITADKTAHVYDYDNRIYEIDFSASSGRYTVEPNITLEFLTDASRSMFFPATLLQKDENDNWLVGRNGSFKYGNSLNLGKWLDEEGVIGTTYYVLTDIQEGSEMSATLYAVYHDGSKWVYTDASYYNAPDGKTGSVREVSSISNGYMKNNNGKKNHLMTGDIYVAPKKESGKDWNRLDYLKAAMTAATNALYDLDPGAQIGLTTFNSSATNQGRYGQANRDDMIDAIGAIQLSGGTNQTSAINLYVDNGSLRNVFTKNSTNKQVAILITDGAPNGTDWTAISNAAKKLRNKNVELFTLGLSLDNVGDNKDNLNGIATDSAHAYSAAQGEEFADQIISMLQKVFSKATLYGDITDTIDPVFYPVDQNGQPIEAGYYYADTTNGAVTRHNNAPTDATKAYYQWINNNGTWTVEWHNQEIKWPEDGGWNKSIFVKAKEDFFGGNSINTNVGDSNKVSSKTFKHSSSSTGYYYLNEDHTAFELPFKIPYVNVDELSLSENSTEWRVYLGTDVNPREELENLWNKIRVNQVIFNNGVNDDEVVTITNRNQMYYSDDRNNDSETPDGSLNETLPLSYFVNSDLLDGLLDQLDDNSTTSTASLTYRYFPYGHDIVGTFDIVLTKTLTDDDAAADHAPEKHETKEVGEEREVYTLTVTYNPTNDNASDTYENTTSGKSAGKVADGYDGTTGNKIDSENVHKIHVFAKDLEIQKKDMTNTSKLIDTAKFKLYRTAKKVIDPETGDETNDYEPSAEELKVGNETKKVVQIGDEMTTSSGKITVEDLSYAPDGTYYLVETKAPDGYIMATEPIEMHLYLDDAYTHYLAPHGSITKAQTVNNPYNWTQAVNRVVYDSSKTAVVDDTKITIEVLNNPGVELPATGGRGTTLIYLLGIMLTAFAGAGLVLRKRRRDAA